ncbi:hypothetical protein LJB98_03785 [Bacteroidales bacterium OttesenSCG-928-M11]|nr:hypothetical protein [Bacteroidales bacterium OttesenSCG-928-M11]
MKLNRISYENLSVNVTYSQFESENGPTEYHAILELSNSGMEAWMQFHEIDDALKRWMREPFMSKASLVWKRYFVTDAANQKDWIKQKGDEAVSIIQQPVLNGSKVALWAYAVEDITVEKEEDGPTIALRPNYSHIFHTQLHEPNGDSYQQTHKVFSSYIKSLEDSQCTLEGNCIRTWIFVQNVDTQYQRMVIARKELFDEERLNPNTHYITSTGIEGKYIYPRVIMTMDAYAIRGIKPEQITFLKGYTHLNPTHDYGVTFERGTSIHYGDRDHIFIAGTASINNKGEIVHPLNIKKQIERTIENISILLEEAGSSFKDVAHLLIYIRDIADYKTVEEYTTNNFPTIPKVILLAPVCRPGWLIEIECMAIKEVRNPQFKDF